MENKKGLHPRNAHRKGYDLAQLVDAEPLLKPYIIKTPAGEDSIDFADAKAVMLLNKALLKKDYKVEHWTLAEGFLCPPVPGRADYIHHAADLLAAGKKTPKGKNINVLDIGTGANLIYPIVGQASYGWSFTGAEFNPSSLAHAQTILKENPSLGRGIKLKQQLNKKACFEGIIEKGVMYSLSVCNPPFYTSAKEAFLANSRKQKNLGNAVKRNFGGQHNELWCNGGELAFIQQMMNESVHYKFQVLWFTSLVAQGKHLKALEQTAKQLNVATFKVIDMAQGQKQSRFVAWTFMTPKQQDLFKKATW